MSQVLAYAERKAAIRALEPGAILRKADRFKHSIKDVLKGGYVRLYGEVFQVVGVSTYTEMTEDFKPKQSGDEWKELTLFSLKTGRFHYLEWEEDDTVVISFTTGSLSFRDLRDDEGGSIDEDDLDEMAEEGWPLKYRGASYSYQDDYAALYDRGNAPGRRADGKSKVYFFDFTTGSETITVEEWQEGEEFHYEIYTSKTVSAKDLEIISLKSLT